MRSRRRLVQGLLAGCVVAAAMSGWAAPDPLGPLVGHRFVTMAYNRSRSTLLTPAAAAEEAEVLLLTAQRVEPENAHTAKLLVEAAAATGDKATQREALRTLVRLDPGNLVAQVQYIELLASAAQTIDERSRVFQGALDSAALDSQVRSEMAVRLANIARERGVGPRAGQYVDQALALNDVNIGALQARVAMAAAKGADELKALIALLKANPLQPEAWVETGRVMERGGLFDPAAQFLNTALEQNQLAGQAMPAELYLELALDLATAGRPVEAHPILEAVSKLEDAPLSALVAAQLLATEYVPRGAATTSAPATQGTEALGERIGKKLAEIVKGEATAAALTDAVWVELSVMPTMAPETEGWMASLRKVVGADDPALVRLEGWKLLREGKLEEAGAILGKAAAGDPLAQLGWARVLLAQHRGAEAQKELRDLWWTHPTGVFALQVAQTARSGGTGVKLAPAISTQDLSGVLATLPSSLATAHREGRDSGLVTATFEKRSVDLEEPVPLQVRIANTTDRAMAVGAGGFFKTTVGLTARTAGVDRVNMGMYAIEDLQRVYRLDPRATLLATVRVDQGAVSEYLGTNPRQTFTVDVSLTSAPRGGVKDATAGLGGQVVPVGDFVRMGRPLGSGNDIAHLLEDMGKATGVEQAKDVQMLAMAVGMLSDEQTRKASRVDEAAEAAEARTSLRAQITKALLPMLGSPSGVLRAWTVLNLPLIGLNELEEKLSGMSADPDPVVRMAWVETMGSVAQQGGAAAGEALQKQGGVERDPVVQRGIKAMLEDVRQTAAAGKAGATP